MFTHTCVLVISRCYALRIFGINFPLNIDAKTWNSVQQDHEIKTFMGFPTLVFCYYPRPQANTLLFLVVVYWILNVFHCMHHSQKSLRRTWEARKLRSTPRKQGSKLLKCFTPIVTLTLTNAFSAYKCIFVVMTMFSIVQYWKGVVEEGGKHCTNFLYFRKSVFPVT